MKSSEERCNMTDKDIGLIREASKILISHATIGAMKNHADTIEARNILESLEQEAFVRAEQSYCDLL